MVMEQPELIYIFLILTSFFIAEICFLILTELGRNPPEGVSVGLVDDNNIFLWEMVIVGPPDTLFEEGLFKATLEFPRDFPNNPPTMTFVSEIWHPNGK